MGWEFKETETCGHVMTGKGTPTKTSVFEHISQNDNSLCHSCPIHLSHKCSTPLTQKWPIHLSHKCPIPISQYALTSHFKFSHNEHRCASWCWYSPARHTHTHSTLHDGLRLQHNHQALSLHMLTSTFCACHDSYTKWCRLKLQ